ncbi:MAG: 4-hydroxy-tetrahydrodipicolinate synthase [Desulfococcaceae bacterium]
MITGAFTALVTPFDENGVDEAGLARLADFQIANGISGILAVGTTGESPVLTWEEHNAVIEKIADKTKGRCLCIAGTGSNNTKEALEAAKHAAKAGADAVLLVDPYYNGPSSLEIRREYVEPVAQAVPDVQVIPYIIPGRTGTQMFPEDLAILHEKYPNVKTVKEATGNLENMKRTRKCCGPDFSILSGDDGLTFDMMTDPAIMAQGVISVASNIAPKAVSDLVRFLAQGKKAEADKLRIALEPLFGLVVVKTTEKTPYGDVVCRARNPLATKTLMAILGMPAGFCRQPLGKMTYKGMEVVLGAAGKLMREHPEILAPAAKFFGADIEARISDRSIWEKFCYSAY